MADFYSTIEDVKKYTGIKPKDLSITETELNSLIEKWLAGVKSLIDADRNRNYTEEGNVPAGIDLIALRMASNLVAIAVVRRDTPIVRVDDFNIQLVRDEIFTEPILRDLSRFPAKPRFRLMRVRTTAEIEEEED